MPHPSTLFERAARRSSKAGYFLIPLGFLVFAAGAFALTLGGVWIWAGAIAWLLSGTIGTSLFLNRVGRPALLPEKEEALRVQLEQLDMACEGLLDQNWELREAEQKYKALLNRQGDIILNLDEPGTILYANDPFEKYFEGETKFSPFRMDTPAEPHEETQESAVPPALADRRDSDHDSDYDGDYDVGPSKDPLWERQIETRMGPRWFRWTETRVRSIHQETGNRLVIARDITAFREVEAASEAKSRFLATISHEMRTPLNGIIGMANLLESTPLSAEQGSYSQALRQSGTALLALVNDVLDLSRIEAGKMTLSYEWTSPARLMEDVVELLAPDAQEKGLSVASWVGASVPDKLLIDPVRVRQILVNLLGNAIKFTPEGAINLSLSCVHEPQEDEVVTLLISVRDTGPGIDDDLKDRLFEEFEQADTTRARQHEGTGLGLAISRRLARMMGGDIELSSVADKGSTFTLRLDASWLNDETRHGVSEAEPFEEDPRLLMGDCLVGIDLTKADERAFYSYCQDWGIAFHAFSYKQWKKEGAALSPDHLLINGAEPDKASDIIAAFDPMKGGRLTRPLPRNRIILLEPSERKVIPQMRNSGISAYLVKPVRQLSLRQSLLGHPNLKDGEEANGAQDGNASGSNAARPSTQDRTDGAKETDKSARILLVEDNEINALLAKTVLEKAGMTIHLATSGQGALDAYSAEAGFDLALLDLHMPDMDGLTLFDAMEASDADRGNSIPKLAFTADALQETREACLSRGFCDYIVKPIQPEELVEIIRRVLDKNAECHKTVL